MSVRVVITGFGLCGPNALLSTGDELSDSNELVAAKDLRTRDRFARMTASAARAALTRAGLDGRDARIGLVLSSVFGPADASSQYLTRLMSSGPLGLSPAQFLDGIASMAAGYASIYLKTTGSIVTLAGGNPLQVAIPWLQTGRESAVLIVGAEAFSDPSRYVMDAFRVANDDNIVSPLFCDAAAALVVETEDSANERHAAQLAEIQSFEIAHAPHDGTHIWAPDMTDAKGRIGPIIGAEDRTARIISCANGVSTLSVAEQRLSFPDSSTIVRPKVLVGETLAASGPIGLIAGIRQRCPTARNSIVVDYQITGEVSVTRLAA